MIFNSVTYILFLALAVFLYWTLPRKQRLLMLLASSITFYGFWSVTFSALMLLSAAIDFFAARIIFASESNNKRRVTLLSAISANLALLVFFKYYYFLADNISGVAALFGSEFSLPYIDIILPIGISFYTFQSMSYTIDVYRRHIEPEREFVLFGVYVTYFPQLIAGPVLRAGEVLWQLDQRPKLKLDDLTIGIRRILAGLFLKVALADNIAPIVDQIYSEDPSFLGPIDIMTMAFLFGLQIYFDFSAYSHIAIGSARCMGIKFPENFNHPYISTSPKEFWRRWHISLSSWIRDYIYLPLAGVKVLNRSTGGIGESVGSVESQTTKTKLAYALFMTWSIMGLWHGAAWAFVVWGLWHAVLVQAHRLMPDLKGVLNRNIMAFGGWVITLSLVMLAWIPFRTQDLGEALVLWSKLFDLNRLFSLGFRENVYLITAILMVLTLLAPIAAKQADKIKASSLNWYRVLDTAVISVMTMVTLVFLRPVVQFIYFQF